MKESSVIHPFSTIQVDFANKYLIMLSLIFFYGSKKSGYNFFTFDNIVSFFALWQNSNHLLRCSIVIGNKLFSIAFLLSLIRIPITEPSTIKFKKSQ